MNRLAAAAAKHFTTELGNAFAYTASRLSFSQQGSQRCFTSSRQVFKSSKGSQTEVEAKLTEEFQTKKAKQVFQKVLNGHHQPPLESEQASKKAAAAASAASSSTGVFDFISNFLFYGSLAAGAIFMGSYAVFTDEQLHDTVAKLQDVKGPVAVGQLVFLERLSWVRDWYKNKTAEFTDPPTDHLLPDLHPTAVQHHLRTLVLDLDEVLVHSEWTRQVGWKTLKRPGASDLLEVLSMYYELVVYTNELSTYADPLLNRIDPGIITNQGPMITFRLYKNACQYKDGEYKRDLSKLNRDLNRVIFVTTKKRASTCMQPENTIVIDDWEDMDPADTTLLDLVPMLQMIVQRDVDDTRDVCKAYEGKDVVATFRERMAKAPPPAKQAAPARRSFFSVFR